MSGPRQVARIAHKARRLLTRDGYGSHSSRRRKRKGPFGPVLYRECGKRGYVNRMAAEAHMERLAETDPRAGRLNVYECRACDFFHVGHSA